MGFIKKIEMNIHFQVYQGIFRALRPDEAEAAEIARERKARERDAAKENGLSV